MYEVTFIILAYTTLQFFFIEAPKKDDVASEF